MAAFAGYAVMKWIYLISGFLIVGGLVLLRSQFLIEIVDLVIAFFAGFVRA